MVSSFIFAPLIALLVGANGGGDLLSLIATQDYWQAKQVTVSAEGMLAVLKPPASQPGDPAPFIKDLGSAQYKTSTAAYEKLRAMGPAAGPALRKALEVAATDDEARGPLKNLIQLLADKGQSEVVRRLMAIRTLGELKDASAVAALEKLVDSKTVFEADYARQALAAIAGRSPTTAPERSAKAIREDLWLLPQNCGVVGQARLPNLGLTGVDDVLKNLPAAFPQEQVAELKAKVTAGLIQAAESVGNVRLDGATFGVADSVGPNSGFEIGIFRGKYDRAAVKTFLMETELFRHEVICESIEGIETLGPVADAFFIMMPSEEQLIIVGGPNRENLPLKELAAAVKAGKGKLSENAEMVKLIKSVDPASNVWAVMKVSDTYVKAKAPVLAPFKDMVGQVQVKKDRVDFGITARGRDADGVIKAAEMFNDGVKEARAGLARALNDMPALQPIADMLAELEVKVGKDSNVTVKGQLKGELPKLMCLPVFLFLF